MGNEVGRAEQNYRSLQRSHKFQLDYLMITQQKCLYRTINNNFNKFSGFWNSNLLVFPKNIDYRIMLMYFTMVHNETGIVHQGKTASPVHRV